MHILVTGGTGLIGGYFIRKYPTYRYTILTRKPQLSAGANIQYINQLSDLENAEKIDIVLNLQGESLFAKRWSIKQKHIIEQSRLAVTKELSTMILEEKLSPAVFISGSAIGFYGRQLTKDIDESYVDCFSEFSHELCKKWEDAANITKDKTRVCTLRTGIVLSRSGGALAQMKPTFKWGLGATVASGKQYMSWIHIDDMARIINHLIENTSIEGPINATAPKPTTNAAFSKALAKQFGRPCFLTMPAPVMTLLLGEVAEILIHGQHVIPKKLTDNGYQFSFPDLTEALNDVI